MVPIFEFGIEIPMLERILGKPLRSFKESNFQNPRVTARDLVQAYHILGLDMVTITDDSFFSRSATPIWIDDRTFVNEFKQIWKIDEDRNTELYYGGMIEISDEMEPVELDPYDEGRASFAKEVVKEARRRGMAVVANVHGGFSSGYLSCGIEKFLISLIRNPTQTAALITTFTRFWTEVAKQLIDVGVEVIGVGDDLADKHGPFIGLNEWRELVRPGLEQMVREVKNRGGIVFFHSDGNINLILDDIAQIRFDGLHSIEPLAGMDIGFVKRKYGKRLCLLGNVDCSQTLCFHTLPRVVEETRRTIQQASHGGGHILCSSNSLHSGVRLENYLMMVATGRRYGRYPLLDEQESRMS
jgi:uroporphyrinogen decarboxylase